MLPTEKKPKQTDLQRQKILIYGGAKIGKTTFAAGAPDALILATEPGHDHIEGFVMPITSWEDLLGALGEIAAGQHAFKTIVIDTVDNAWRFCEQWVCATNNESYILDGKLGYGKGSALAQNEFFRVLTKLGNLPYGLMLISHSQEVEVDSRVGKYHRIVPTLPDSGRTNPRRIVLGFVDLVLYADIQALGVDASGNQGFTRVLRTKPSLAYEAGDRSGRLPEVIDLNYDKFAEAWAFGDPRCNEIRTALRGRKDERR